MLYTEVHHKWTSGETILKKIVTATCINFKITLQPIVSITLQNWFKVKRSPFQKELNSFYLSFRSSKHYRLIWFKKISLREIKSEYLTTVSKKSRQFTVHAYITCLEVYLKFSFARYNNQEVDKFQKNYSKGGPIKFLFQICKIELAFGGLTSKSWNAGR